MTKNDKNDKKKKKKNCPKRISQKNLSKTIKKSITN